MKVLISAYSCEPGTVDEPGVNWHIVRELANYHEVWVLTRSDECRDRIEAELARYPKPNLHFVCFTLPFWKSRKWRHSERIQLHYYFWQIPAYFVARRLHQKIGFDLIHDMTFVQYSHLSFLSLLPLPLVLGSVGSKESAPVAFWQDFSWQITAYEIIRSTLRWLGKQNPFKHLTTKRSTVVRVTAQDTAKQLHQLGVSQVKILPELGLSEEDIARLAKYEVSDVSTVRFISIGKLWHWEGLHIGLRAFAQANLPNTEYWIVGEGAESERLQTLARDLQVDRKVKFWGQLPREKALDLLKDCHILVHPSLHDSGGWVCIEAMAAGRPVLCLNLGEPSIQVTDETGIKIPADEPYQAVRDLAAAMIQLVKNPPLRVGMGQAGRIRVRQNYSWKVVGEQMNHLYTQIVQQATP